MMVASMISDLRRKMEGALDILQKEYQGLRTGRVSPALLEPVVVEAYGGTMPLSQTATVSVSDNRMLVVQVWDKELVKSVDRAIRESGLGVNPITEGQSIRVILPELSEERRKELCKVASKYCEQAKISVRNVRRDGMDSLKKMEKDKEISEDENNRYSDQIQKLTDEFVKKIDELSSSKEKEILKV